MHINFFVAFTKALLAAIRAIRAIFENCGVALEGEVLLLIAATRAGKTTAMDEFMIDLHARLCEERSGTDDIVEDLGRITATMSIKIKTATGYERPFVKVFVDKNPTYKGLLADVLRAMGVKKVPRSMSGHERLDLLIHQIIEQKTKVIAFDETQHISEFRSREGNYTAADVIKSLVKAGGVQIICCGLPHATEIADANQQVEELISTIHTVKPLPLDLEPDSELRTFLGALNAELPFDHPSDLADPPLALKIGLFCDGYQGRIAKLIHRAVDYAITEKLPCLDMNVFASLLRVRFEVPDDANIFLMAEDGLTGYQRFVEEKKKERVLAAEHRRSAETPYQVRVRRERQVAMTLHDLSLPRWVVPKPEEPPHGCLLRLAEANGLPDVATVQLLTNVKLSAIRNGRNLDDLAQLLHCDVGTLQQYATFYNGDTRTIVAGQLLRRRADVSLGTRRVCPECMVESAHQRFWCDLQFITTCPVHRAILVDRCSCGDALTWNDGSTTKCLNCKNGDVRKILPSPARDDVLAFDRWALDRLTGEHDRSNVPIVNAMDLGDAVETIERIGSLVVGGYQDHWRQIADFELPAEVVRAIGFNSVVEGRIGQALDRAYEGFVEQNPDQLPAISRMYGWFFGWFRYNGGDRFSKELAGVILSNACAKIQVTKRAFSLLLREESTITLSQAAKICRVRTGTLRKLLATEDLIRDEKRKGAPIRVRRDVAERIARDLEQSMTLTALGPFIGVSNTSLLKLVRSGTVPTWVMGGNHAKHRYLFRKAEVTDWFNKLIGTAPLVQRRQYGTVPIADAPLRCGIAMKVLIEAILAEKIAVIAVLDDKRNLAGALLSVRAVAEYRRKIGPEAAQDPIQRYFRFEAPTSGGASNGRA
jgi:hypothetical protein